MAKFSYAEYSAAQERKANATSTTSRSRVSYFGLKNDGDEAIVRFAYSSPDEFDLVAIHNVPVGDGKFRRVSCLRKLGEPVDKCPFCNSKDETISKVYSKFFVKLLEYVRDENGQIVAKPGIWEKSAAFSRTLASYFAEYGDISDVVFKIKRHGAARSMDTSYDLVVANPAIYKAETYVKDFSAFDNYDLNKFVVLNKSAAEMTEYLESGEFPSVKAETAVEEMKTLTVSPVREVPTENVQYSGPSTPADQGSARDFTSSTARPVRRYEI